jgi:pre-mRNA-splicing factor ATP-dependent RNA helicase DHX15/PRP43
MSNKGILDPEGNNNNPFSGEPYSEEYKKLGKVWSKYPAYEKRIQIIDMIKNNQVIILTSDTGSGKTVLVPKFLMHALDYKTNIAITLPKQITTKSAAEFAAKTLDVKLGEYVGYKYRGSDKKYISNKTQMLYTTDGTIIAKLMNDPILREYNGVIIDEAHERSKNMDFLFYLLRNVVKERPEFKLIIMSATIDLELFKNYYKDFKTDIVNISGKTNYPIDTFFSNLNIKQNNYLDEGYKILKETIMKNKLEEGARDIIFFVPSVAEAMRICEQIKKDNLDIFCVEVYSGMNKESEELALDKIKYREKSGKNRKLIMATGVAESSVTFEGIKYVIDSGYELFGYYDPVLNSKTLEKRPITQSQALQRRGRAGRTEPGICYHLYKKEDFEKMNKFPQPSIRTSDIAQECLRLLNLPNIKKVDVLIHIFGLFIEPPRELNIIKSVKELQRLKMIENMEITKLGEMLSDLNMEPKQCYAIYLAKKLSCSFEVCKIFALLDICKNNLRELFNIPDKTKKDLLEKFNKQKKNLTNKLGDHLSILDIFNKYINAKNKDDFLYKYFINREVMKKADALNDKYINNARKIKYDKIDNKYELNNRILYCIYKAYDIVPKNRNGDYEMNNNYVNISKNSFIFDTNKDIFSQELFNNNGKLELNIVSLLNNEIKEIDKLIN